MNALAAALVSLGLALLDRRLDSWIDKAHLSGVQKEQLKKAEDETIELLRVALGKASPRVLSLILRAIPNDKSTGSWAG